MAKSKQTKNDGVELVEGIDLRGSQNDLANGVVRHVKIIGKESRNGRKYAEGCLRKAAKLYEGIRVNVDHPSRLDGSSERSYRDRFGSLKNITPEGDDLFGDLHFNPKHALAEQFVWDAEHAPENVGFSHRAFGRGRQVGDTYLVEEISIVRSVDLVADPATTRGLFESYQPEHKEHVVSKTLKEILESHKADFRAAQLLLLVEEDMGGLPVDLPAADGGGDLPAEDQIWAAFKSAVNAVLDDDKMDIPASIKRITEILKSYEKLEAKPEAAKEEKKPEGADATESLRNELAELKAKSAKLEGQQAAYRLLQESHLPANPIWVEAIASLPEASRKAFVESIPKDGFAEARSATPFSESDKTGGKGAAKVPETADEFVAAITN